MISTSTPSPSTAARPTVPDFRDAPTKDQHLRLTSGLRTIDFAVYVSVIIATAVILRERYHALRTIAYTPSCRSLHGLFFTQNMSRMV